MGGLMEPASGRVNRATIVSSLRSDFRDGLSTPRAISRRKGWPTGGSQCMKFVTLSPGCAWVSPTARLPRPALWAGPRRASPSVGSGSRLAEQEFAAARQRGHRAADQKDVPSKTRTIPGSPLCGPSPGLGRARHCLDDDPPDAGQEVRLRRQLRRGQTLLAASQAGGEKERAVRLLPG